jgi:hypothetical protein
MGGTYTMVQHSLSFMTNVNHFISVTKHIFINEFVCLNKLIRKTRGIYKPKLIHCTDHGFLITRF